MVRKNNFINRIFYSSEINKNYVDYYKQKDLVENHKKVLQKVLNAANFEQLIIAHKYAYEKGYHENLGPDKYGMFRTSEIESMVPSEVFLGGIYGLYTKEIPFWEEHGSEKLGTNGWGINPERSLYDIVFEQYRLHLLRNIHWIAALATAQVQEYEIRGYR